MPSEKIFEWAIAKQAAKGAIASVAQYRARLSGGDMQPTRNVQDFAETGTTRLPRTSFVASMAVDGSPAMGLRDDIYGLLLYGALGTKGVLPTGANTTLAASAIATATNIKVTAVTGMTAGETLLIGLGATRESKVILTVGTAGAGGTGIELTTALANPQTSGDPVVEDPYEHTITPANSLPYFTCWRMQGDQIWERFEDCKVGQLETVSEVEAALIATATMVGTKSKALSSGVYATEATAAPLAGAGEAGTGLYVHHHGSGLLTVEGTVISRMERVAVTIANGSEGQLGDSVFPDDISEGAQEITVATRQRVTNADLYNRLHYGTPTPSSGTDPTGTILELGAGGLNMAWRRQPTPEAPSLPERSIRFISGSRVQLTGIGGRAPGTGNNPLREEPTYRILDPDSGVAFTAKVRNLVAAY